ncbi:MAG: BrnT family toxin [Paracoccaceae bacterium]
MSKLEFEWDKEKRLATIAKHNIDFIDAIEVFGGKVVILPAKSEIESRQVAVAPLGEKMIAVVFTVRGEIVRIITARAARKNEREQYQNLYPRTDQSDEG